jgi:hypothetical protein
MIEYAVDVHAGDGINWSNGAWGKEVEVTVVAGENR